jgi:integrase
MPRKLTKAYLDGLRPAATDRFEWDTDVRGFGIRLWPSGRRSWVFKYDHGGRSRRFTIGDADATPLDEARRRARELRTQVDKGMDPLATREHARAEAVKEADRPTVATLFDEFLEVTRAKRRESTADEYERLLGSPVAKRGADKGKARPGELRRALGALHVHEVTFDDIHRLHLRMKDRKTLANRSVAILRAAFNLAEKLGWRARHTNPCEGVTEYEEKKHERYLTADEYQRLGAAITTAATTGLPLPSTLAKQRATAQTAKHRAKTTAGRLAPANPIAVAALRLLLLTGWRKSEVLGLRWEELYPESGFARLPRTKTGHSDRYLGAAAWELLEEIAVMTGSSRGYVFPGLESDKHYQGIKRLWLSVRHAAGLDNVRLHDTRHAAASVAVSEGLSLPVIGALLGHRDTKSTQRYAHLAQGAQQRAADEVSERIRTSLSATEAVASAAAPSRASTILEFTKKKPRASA